MQGRLSPMIFGGYQAFPTDLWPQEFQLARDRGLQHVEWVIDFPSLAYNPILTDIGSIATCCADSGVQVISVCADFLMDQPLDVDLPETWTCFEELLGSMAALGAKYVVIPCVDASSLYGEASRRRLLRATGVIDGLLAGGNIRVALETDLPPVAFQQLLEGLDPNKFGVNYDIGNSASLGFDPAEELGRYGSRINLLHVKDRQLQGGSVRLGTGSANLRGALSLLRELQFRGPVTLQCFRDLEGIAVFDEQLAMYRSMIEDLFRGS
jgi:L-ribulose-5-phosphate 3-epimerase